MTHPSSRSSTTELDLRATDEFEIFRDPPELEAAGAIVSIEGPDGSGKSTLANMLVPRLSLAGRPAILTSWNETTEIYNLMMRLNAVGLLTNDMRCTFGSVELAARYHYVVRPALHRGDTVLINKYLVSATAHAMIRGHDPAFVEMLYSFALEPDVTIYLDIPPRLALERKLSGGGTVGFWEAGLDLALDLPVDEALRLFRSGAIESKVVAQSFVDFQTRLRDIQLSLLDGQGARVVDGRRPAADVAEEVLLSVISELENVEQMGE